MKKTKLISILSIPLLMSTSVFADITFNGFASIKGSYVSSEGEVPFTKHSSEGEVSFKDLSLFALQARSDLGEGLSATIQLMAEGSNDFNVEARWAYLSYEINDQHILNIGRFANPIFHQSEYEKIGFAHNYDILPRSVYIGFDFSTIEGVSLNSTFNTGMGDLSTKILYGNWNGDIYLTSTNQNHEFGLNQIVSINATLESDWWKIYAGGFTTTIVADDIDNSVFTPLIQGTGDQFGVSQSEVNQTVSLLGWHDKDGLYWFAGFGLDYNNWLVDFEYASYVIEDSVNGVNDTYFLGLGKRFNEHTVMFYIEDYDQEDADWNNGSVTHPAMIVLGDTLSVNQSFRKFDGYGVTWKYNFHSNAAFKLGLNKSEDTRPTVGDYTTITAGIDLVF